MRIYLKISLITCFLFSNYSLNAQGYKPPSKRKQFYGNQRLQKPLFKWVTGPNKRHGLQVQFGATYLFTNIQDKVIETVVASRPIEYTLNATGDIGAFAEIGMVHITKKPRKFIQYYDWGIGYKHFNGNQSSTVEFTDLNGSVTQGKGSFSNGYAYCRFGIHSVFQINPRHFLDNSLGINLDYNLVRQNQDYDGVVINNTDISPFFQDEIIGQINYSFGFGFKPRAGFFVIPGFRLPIFEAYEWRGGNPSIEWFSSKYMPAMFKLKLVWLFKKDPNRCPAVETNDADKKKNDAYRNGM